MPCFVIKRDNVIYAVEDSSSISSVYDRGKSFADPENRSIWFENRKKKQIIVNMYDPRKADLLRYEKIFPSELNMKNLAYETYPKVKNILKKMNKSVGIMCFIEKDKGYIMTMERELIKLEDGWYGIDPVSDFYELLYEENKEMPVYDLIKEMVRNVEKIVRVKYFPVMVIDSEGNQQVFWE